jgi:hypothetical protein
LQEYFKTEARDTGILSGKWMIFGKGRFIEVQWAKVKDALYASKLGACAKLLDDNGRTRVICVCTYSFEDEDDIGRVLMQLHAMEVYPTSWTSDISTYLNIYVPTQFKLKAKQGWFVPVYFKEYREKRNPKRKRLQ